MNFVYLFVNKPITTYAELKGMSLRTRANYDRFFKALGISGVSVDTGEVYTSLERGIVGVRLDARGDRPELGYKAPNMMDEGSGSQQRDPSVQSQSWAALSANQQQAIIKATADFEMDQMIPSS